MNKERIAELRIEALNAKYAGKEFAIPASESMEILNLAMNQLEPRVTPEMWKELGRIEAERTTAPVSLTDDDLTQEFSLDAIIKGIRYADHGRHEGWQAELKEYIRIECNRALLAAAPAPIQQEPVGYEYRAVANNLPESRRNSWVRCTKAAYESYKENPFINNVRWEVRELYAATPPALAGSQVQAAGDALDAARYRFLRDGANNGYHLKGETNIGKFHVTQKIRDGEGLFYHEEFLDAAIDAAMREKP